MKIYLILLLLVTSFKGFSALTPDLTRQLNPSTPCYQSVNNSYEQDIFANPPFNKTIYSEANLKGAMESSNYRKITKTYPKLTREETRNLFKL